MKCFTYYPDDNDDVDGGDDVEYLHCSLMCLALASFVKVLLDVLFSR